MIEALRLMHHAVTNNPTSNITHIKPREFLMTAYHSGPCYSKLVAGKSRLDWTCLTPYCVTCETD